jgi:hypothetical protein
MKKPQKKLEAAIKKLDEQIAHLNDQRDNLLIGVGMKLLKEQKGKARAAKAGS